MIYQQKKININMKGALDLSDGERPPESYTEPLVQSAPELSGTETDPA